MPNRPALTPALPTPPVTTLSETDLIYLVNRTGTDPRQRLAALVQLAEQGKVGNVSKDAMVYAIADLARLLL